MNGADYIILGILAISVVFGVMRGFMREALALIGWLGGLWLAWRYADAAKPLLGGLLGEEPLRTWVARGMILAAVLISMWIVAEVMTYFIHQSGLSASVDRLLGGVFGFLRGIVLVALVAMLGAQLNLQDVRWWKRSELIPYAETIGNWLGQFAETARDAVDEVTS